MEKVKKILLLGDSLFAFYNWQLRLPAYDIVNQGVPGETVAGLLRRLPGEVSAAGEPDTVFIMIGTNNLAMDDYTFLPEYGAILHRLSDLLPKAGVVITSLLPLRLSWLAESAVARLNKSLLELARRFGVDYLDVYDAFTPGGKADSSCFLEDGVHLTDEGYQRWSDVLEIFLQGDQG